jgi:hypothetical protein
MRGLARALRPVAPPQAGTSFHSLAVALAGTHSHITPSASGNAHRHQPRSPLLFFWFREESLIQGGVPPTRNTDSSVETNSTFPHWFCTSELGCT